MPEKTIVEYKSKEYQRCHYCRGKAYFFDTVNNEYLCSSLPSNCQAWKGYQAIPEHKCFYCKTRQAVAYYPTANRYCCEKNYRHCPGVRQNMRASTLKQNENSPFNTLRREIREGKHLCIYCGMTSNYLITRGPCCADRARSCPGHSLWLRKRMIKKYEDQPELRERMREISREVHNRPDVIDKKSATMLHLHRDDCTKCKDFQSKFKKAHARRRGKE